MSEMIRVLLVEPHKHPRLVEVEHTLENLQKLVGGDIAASYPWDDLVGIVYDDDGKFKGYPANRLLTDEDGNPYDIIVGTFYICGLSREDFDSIPDDLAEKYTEKFRHPEFFRKTEDGYVFMYRIGSGDPPVRII